MIETTCLYCGTGFTIQPSVIARGGGRYCSRECGEHARKGVPLESGYVPKSQKRMCVCQACGKEFQLAASKIAEGRGTFCSQECRKARYTRQCEFCGQDFRVRQSSHKRYCSMKCVGEAKKIPLTDCICEHCGQKFMARVTEQTRFCSLACSKIDWNDYFFDIPSADGAYIVGFIIADGSLSGNAIQVGQARKDILFKIAERLGHNGKLGHNNSVSLLSLYSPHACEILTTKYDIPAKDKTYCVGIPSIIEKNTKLLPHLIRGLWDGDGSVSLAGSSSFTSASSQLIQGLVEILESQLGISPARGIKWTSGNKVKKDGTISGGWEIHYNILETIALAKYMYGPNLGTYGSSLYLERKRERFIAKITPFRDYEWMREKFINEGKSASDIAALLGVKKGQITTYLDKFGLKPKPSHFYRDPEWMRKKFVDEEKSPEEIARGAGIRSKRTILKSLYEMGLVQEPPLPRRTWGHRRVEKLDCLETVLSLRHNNGLSFSAIAQHVQNQGELVDLKPRSVEHALRRYFARSSQP